MRSILFAYDSIPAILFSMRWLSQSSLINTVIFLILGVDLIIIGIGLWKRYELAFYFGGAVFALAFFLDIYNIIVMGLSTNPVIILGSLMNLVLLGLILRNKSAINEVIPL
jgi:uncharacterized membrane protein (DUF2068 family)